MSVHHWQRLATWPCLLGLVGLISNTWPPPVGAQADLRAVVATAFIAHAPLVAADGTTTTLEQLVDRYGVIVLSLTYSGCQSICPTSDLIMNAFDEATTAAPTSVGLVTLSIDPFNDTPDVLRRRAVEIGAGPRRHWLTGAPQNVFSVLDGLGVEFGNRDDHPPAFFVFARGGRKVLRIDGLPDPRLLQDAVRSVR